MSAFTDVELALHRRIAELEAQLAANVINDLCPSCGNRSLFIGSGGLLTCSLIGCREPGVSRAIAAKDAELAEIKAATAAIMDEPCNANERHCSCVPLLRMSIEKLREQIEDLLYQFAYDCDGPCLITGGLSTLEEAFSILGWTDPHEIPEQRCDEPGCTNKSTCGWPDGANYRRTCGKHMKP